MSTKYGGEIAQIRTGIPVKIESRADGKQVISGYAAVFYNASDSGTAYRMWRDTEERILPGAFDEAIKSDDVRALFNHEAGAILGRTSAGTCRLSTDAKGLKYEIDLPDTQLGRDLAVSIARGDVSASSFGFVPMSTQYREEMRDGQTVYIIERTSVRLFDVSPVTFPAYTSTTVGVRDGVSGPGDTIQRELQEWKQRQLVDVSNAVKIRARAVEIATIEGQ